MVLSKNIFKYFNFLDFNVLGHFFIVFPLGFAIK